MAKKISRKTTSKAVDQERAIGFPDSAGVRLARFSRRVMLRAGGGALILLALWLLISLASFSISDPTWNTATPAKAQNFMGTLGATIADFTLQSIGGAIFLLLSPMIIWGFVALLRGTPEQTSFTVWVRILLAPISILAGAGLLSCLPVPASWPFAASLGGVSGDGVVHLISGLFAIIDPPYPVIFSGMIFFAILAYTYPVVCGLTRERSEAALDILENALLDVAAMVTSAFSIMVAAMAPLFGKKEDKRYGEELREVLSAVDALDEDYVDEVGIDDNYQIGTLEIEEEDDIGLATPGLDLNRKRQIIRSAPRRKPSKRESGSDQRELPVFQPGSYELPPLSHLAKPDPRDRAIISDEALEQNARMLETVLSDFGVRGEIINVRPGPVVTLYELEPAAGVKSSRVIGLADDIARSMSAVAARVAVVPGRNVIGIELPNQNREMVYLRSQLGSHDFENSKADLTLALGVDIGGEAVFADLARMPHLLIAGTTGSGKSVGINTMILSLLYRLSPDQCKLILIDPKMLELSVYEGIPHLLSPVVTDPRKAVVALKWTVREMEERYQKMSKVGVRNVAGFNERVRLAAENGETLSKTVHTGYDEDTGEPVYETEELDYKELPFIVVVIDEVADLMMVAGKDIEGMVQRLAQMARAAGIHLVMATQRPSVDVITGTIKANFPTRISFQVTSKIDSRTILGEQGAEQLLGMGDMLYMAGGGRIRRVHAPFVSDSEVEKTVKFLKKQGKPIYVQEVTEMAEGEGDSGGFDVGGNTSSGDALYDQAVAVVVRDRKASTSYIQRRLQIGYNRAATLIERMEEQGVISPANHAGKREILIGEDAA